MIEVMLPLAYPSPQPKRQSDQLRCFWHAQLMAESPYTLQWATLSHKIAPSHVGSGPHLIHDSLGHSEIRIQTA